MRACEAGVPKCWGGTGRCALERHLCQREPTDRWRRTGQRLKALLVAPPTGAGSRNTVHSPLNQLLLAAAPE